MADESGSERYEAVSAEWVKALGEHVAERFGHIKFYFDGVWSQEFRNPPAHLLRDDGRSSIGYRVQVKNGKVEVLDGYQHHGSDLVMIVDYDPVAYSLRIPEEEYGDYLAKTAPALVAEGKITIIGNNALTRGYWGFMGDIRRTFFSKHTA